MWIEIVLTLAFVYLPIVMLIIFFARKVKNNTSEKYKKSERFIKKHCHIENDCDDLEVIVDKLIDEKISFKYDNVKEEHNE